MPKDFAGRAKTTGQKRKASRPKKPTKRVSPKQRVLFHGPSFATGALVGAAIVVLAAYGPQLLQTPSNSQIEVLARDSAEPVELEFEFPEMLRSFEIQADPEPYAVPEEKKRQLSQTYHIQAASFRNRSDADQLRAQLLLDNLPATVATTEVREQTWYRVVVGPFPGRLEADRAMTRLREQGLTALRINNG